MSSYDLKSYAVALMLRKRKTIVVEGNTDNRVISRILLENESASGKTRQCVIDEVSLLGREEAFYGLGNRDRVISTGLYFAALSDKLKCLVDREWDNVNLLSLQDPHPVAPAPIWGYMTRGHSIENYWFTAAAACSFFKMQYGAQLQMQFFIDLSQRFDSMLRIAAGFSLAAKRLNVITTCQKGLLKADHVVWTNGSYHPTPQLTLAGNNRGIAADLAFETQAELNRADFAALTMPTVQWLCHGHLGEQMLRACAASLAKEFGYIEIAESVERGFQDIKLAHDADWLAITQSSVPTSLNALIVWAT